MSSFAEALAQLRQHVDADCGVERPAPPASRSTRADTRFGIEFEKLMVNYFRTDPVLSRQYDQVCRWDKWEHRASLGDVGIDMVARRREDHRWVAIQCKCFAPTTTVAKSHIDSFLSASGRTFGPADNPQSFAQRIIISTTDRWSSNAEAMLEHQQIPTSRIGTAAIAESPIDWDIAFPGSEAAINLTLRQTFEPRPHQRTAIRKVLDGFRVHDRGKLIMACGTGKTFTALRLAERLAEQLSPAAPRARVLFCVPSISLLSQTLKEWTAQARQDLRFFAVCSDQQVSSKAEDIATYDLEVPVSTKAHDVVEALSRKRHAAGLTVVFSTYQSLAVIQEAQGLENPLDPFDLIICDEAHRTTGVTLAGEKASNFVLVHNEDAIKGTKRLYMTATPRLYDQTVKEKAEEHSAEIASMDDEALFGPELHRLGFGEAVEKGLLTDYKVLVTTVDEALVAKGFSREDQELNLPVASAMIGAWNGLATRSGNQQGTKQGFPVGAPPMRRAVAFAENIEKSKKIARLYPALIDSHRQLLKENAEDGFSQHNVDVSIEAHHVDGSMNALRRGKELSWLEAEVPDSTTIRMLTNARCLSEGVDVPALDAVVFFHPRNSMVDVVQSVGRVMRKSPGKDYGYIILPVAIPEGKNPAEVLNENKAFKVVWQILNALRAHDDRFNAKVNSAALNESPQDALPIQVEHVAAPRGGRERRSDAAGYRSNDSSSSATSSVSAQELALFSLEDWQQAFYAKLVDKVGTRTYWEDWADDVAEIAAAQISRINALLAGGNPRLRKAFREFVAGLRGNLNDSITEEQAIGMLSQHLITAPVFNALFSEHDFASHNPVSRVMQKMVDALSDTHLNEETARLQRFYDSVQVRASEVTSAAGKQEVVRELYERFFRTAFKKQSDALGIVYTPVEIVDFILRSADDLLRAHLGRGLTDAGVHILDPFAGTGTFLVRLLESGLIRPEDLARKYASELHATEIMLLAYYVAAVNIESTYNALVAERAEREKLQAADAAAGYGVAGSAEPFSADGTPPPCAA